MLVKDPMQEAIEDFEIYLRSESKARGTVSAYVRSVEILHKWVVEQGIFGWDQVTTVHLRKWLDEQTTSPSRIAMLRASARSFFGYLSSEEWMDGRPSPAARLKGKKIPAPLVPVLSEEQLGALIASAKKNTNARRDEAIIRVFIDTGARLNEVTGIKVTDLDLGTASRVLVHGKGGKDRYVPFGTKATLAIRRYLRERQSASEALWLGHQGPMSKGAIYRLVVDTGLRAGILVRPHQLRHTFVSNFRDRGGSLDALILLAGWDGMEMALRYGRATLARRAEAEARQISLGDTV